MPVLVMVFFMDGPARGVLLPIVHRHQYGQAESPGQMATHSKGGQMGFRYKNNVSNHYPIGAGFPGV